MYFDNAATSFPKPSIVCDAVDHWMRFGAASAGRGTHRGTDEAGRMIDECRNLLARRLGAASSSHVIFTLNCTDSLNCIFRGFLRPGDRVIASTLDHNSVIRPLQALGDEMAITVEYIEFDPVSGLLDVEQFERQVRRRQPRLVVLNHASNVTGRIQPVRQLSQIASEAGAKVLLDAAQTAGHCPIDMNNDGIDFLVAAGHKGLSGPLGTGVLSIRPGLEHEVRPLRYGGTGTTSESPVQPLAMPSRFESGNLNLPGIAGLHAAMQWLESSEGIGLHTRLHQNLIWFRTELAQIPGVTIHSPASHDVVPLLSLSIAGYDCRDVAMILDQSFNIQSRAGLHCAPLAHRTLGTFQQGGTLRLSPGFFTTDEEFSAAIDAIHQIAEAMNS
ncbi:MAG: aminotransferase class V-fold PLP-dependent enzyme [Planctomycetota bacterium]